MPNPLPYFKEVSDFVIMQLKTSPNWEMTKHDAVGELQHYQFYLLEWYGSRKVDNKEVIHKKEGEKYVTIRISVDNELRDSKSENWRVQVEVNGVPLKRYHGEIGTLAIQFRHLYDETDNYQTASTKLWEYDDPAFQNLLKDRGIT